VKRIPALALLLLALAHAPVPRAEDPLPQQPAAEIDPAPFASSLPITVPPAPAGVARLSLSPEVLAAARADLADLRVVDAASRQWPYVLRPEVGRAELALRVELQRGERGRSRYLLALPVAPAAVDVVTIAVDRAFFDRPFRLLGDPPGPDVDPRTLATGRLSRKAGAEPIAVAFPRARVRSLTLVVDDGDEAPLPISSARAGLPLAELRLLAPPGAYTVLVGDPTAEPPRYEIARLRDRILAAEAPPCTAGALLPNARHAPHGTSLGPRRENVEQLALWGVLGLAVVALAGLALRMSRQEKR
jgi:hypothetical protein